MVLTPQHEFVRALAQAYRGLAELLHQPLLSEDSRRSVLLTLVTLEREIGAWSEPFAALEDDGSGNRVGDASIVADFEDEPTQPNSEPVPTVPPRA